MINRLIFGSIWLSFVVYAFFLAPPSQPDTINLLVDLSIGKIQQINPLIVALFYLMGILPAIYACFLLIDGLGQKLPASIFVIGSFGLGAFVLLPYFALRTQNSVWDHKKSWLIKLVDSRITGIILTLGTISLVFFGFRYGDWSDFIQQWQTTKFINVMSLDFCLLCLLFPVMLKDDLAKRGIKNPIVLALISGIPLLGTLIYLCFRPRLTEN